MNAKDYQKWNGSTSGTVVEPLYLLSTYAMELGYVSAGDVEAAKASPQPIPAQWPFPQKTWMAVDRLKQS